VRTARRLARRLSVLSAELLSSGFTFARNPAHIAAEARFDGFYVIRTSIENNALAAEGVVGAYKGLARVERAFRSLKTVDLHIRPIHHWLAPRVRAHVFLCMLACHVEWHMRERLKPILFDDDDPAAAARERASIIAPAQSSPAALRKRASKVTADGGPVHSFQNPAARPRHLHPQRDDHHPLRRVQLHPGGHPDPAPSASLPPARCRSD
jgi:hypothetical protein